MGGGVPGGVVKGSVVTSCYPEIVTSEQRTKLEDAVWVSPERVSGTPCFRDTRVPVQSLIDFLEGGETLDQFLAVYPGVTRARAVAVLDLANSQVLECASSLTSA